jgi:hypothetical protein
MAQQNKNRELTAFEEKARELVSLTFDLCELHMAKEEQKPLPSGEVLEAAALSVQASVKTLLAVTNSPRKERA